MKVAFASLAVLVLLAGISTSFRINRKKRTHTGTSTALALVDGDSPSLLENHSGHTDYARRGEVKPEECTEKVIGSIPSGGQKSGRCECKKHEKLIPSASEMNKEYQKKMCQSSDFDPKEMWSGVCLCSDWSTSGGCLNNHMEGFHEMADINAFIEREKIPFAYDYTEMDYKNWLAHPSSAASAKALEQVVHAILGCFKVSALDDKVLLRREVSQFFSTLHLDELQAGMLLLSDEYQDPLDEANTPITSIRSFVRHVAELVKRNPMVLAFVEITVHYKGHKFDAATQCPDLRNAVFYCYFLHVLAYALVVEKPKIGGDTTKSFAQQVEETFSRRKADISKEHRLMGLYNLSQSMFEFAKLKSLELGLAPYKRQDTLTTTPLYGLFGREGTGYEFRWLGPFMNIREAVIEDSSPDRGCFDNAEAGDFLAQYPLISDRVLTDLGIYGSGQNPHFARVWSNLYNSWNLDFLSSTFKDFVMFWPKLLNPATFGLYNQREGEEHPCIIPDLLQKHSDKSDARVQKCTPAGLYMLPRVITLVTHIQYIIEKREETFQSKKTIEDSCLTKETTWRSRWFSSAFGVINRVAAQQIEARLAVSNRGAINSSAGSQIGGAAQQIELPVQDSKGRVAVPKDSTFGRITNTIPLANFSMRKLPATIIASIKALGYAGFPIINPTLSVRIVA